MTEQTQPIEQTVEPQDAQNAPEPAQEAPTSPIAPETAQDPAAATRKRLGRRPLPPELRRQTISIGLLPATIAWLQTQGNPAQVMRSIIEQAEAAAPAVDAEQ